MITSEKTWYRKKVELSVSQTENKTLINMPKIIMFTMVDFKYHHGFTGHRVGKRRHVTAIILCF